VLRLLHGLFIVTKDFYGYVLGWPVIYGGILSLCDHWLL